MQKDDTQAFQDLLEKKGLKLTRERRELIAEVLRLKIHFDADSLHDLLKGKGSQISRDTVYRTLPLLLECGVVQKSVGDGRREYFERTSVKGHHDHMVCIQCGKIIEFHSSDLEKLQSEICEEYQFRLVFHDHRLFGHCKDCAK